MENNSDTIEIAKEPEEDGKPSLVFWKAQLEAYDNAARTWRQDVDAAFDEYMNDTGRGKPSPDGSSAAHFPLFWAAARTIQPALYSRTPIIVTEKAFREMRDPVARLAAVLLERLGKYAAKTSGFDRAMSIAVLHFIMGEKASVRVVFESDIEESKKRSNYRKVSTPIEGPNYQLMMDTRYYTEGGEEYTGEVQEDAEGPYSEETEYDIKHLRCFCEPMHYQDYRHTANARYEDEIDFMAYDTQLSRQEVADAFGDQVAAGLTYSPVASGKDKDKSKEIKGLPDHKATITQIWDLKKRKVYYLSLGYSDWLVHKNNPEGDDPYKLERFFPSAPFILGTYGAQDMFPAPAYVQLRDFIKQVHGAFDRFRRQVLALKKAGVFDASKGDLAELNNMLSEGQFIGVHDLEALLGPNGSLDRIIHFFPTDKIAQGVRELKEVLQDLEQKLYDLWGIPDIYRGITDPNETLGAQQLKGKHMSVRFSVLQGAVQLLARDTLEIMCDLYLGKCPETKLREIMGVRFLSPEEQQMFPQALALLKNDTERCIRLDIETDSTITQNMNADIEQKNYLAKTVFEGLGALKDVNPVFMPLAAHAVELGIKSLQQGKHVEGDLEQAFDAMKQAAAQPPPPPPPDPALAVEQLRQQGRQMEIQADAQQHQQDLQLKFQELQLKAQELQVEMQLEREKLQVEMQKIAQEGQIEGVKTQLDAQIKASEQQLDAMRVEIEQYKAVLDEREKFMEEKRLAHDQKTDNNAHILEAISLVTGKPLPSDVRRKEEAENKKRKRKHTIRLNEDDNTAVVETEEVNE